MHLLMLRQAKKTNQTTRFVGKIGQEGCRLVRLLVANINFYLMQMKYHKTQNLQMDLVNSVYNGWWPTIHFREVARHKETSFTVK